MKSARILAPLVSVAFALVGCPAVEAPMQAPRREAPIHGGARWSLHPQRRLEPAARTSLPGGATLYVGPDGTRWLEDGSGVQAAEQVLLANLVGAEVLHGGGVALTSDDGTVFIAPAPLAAAKEVRRGRAALRSKGATTASALRLSPSIPRAKLEGATAVRAGRGAIARGRWLEVTPEGAGRWGLQASALGGPIDVRPLPMLDGCAQAWLVADEMHEWIACTPGGDRTRLRVFDSDDGGEHFRERPPLTTLASDEVRLFAIAGGKLFVEGACRTDAAAPCAESAKIVLEAERVRDVDLDASMHIHAARSGGDGTLYALATAGTGITYLLSSRDDGASFSTLDLPMLAACGCSPTVEASALAVAGDGQVAVIAYANADRWLRYASSDHGAHVDVTLLPIAPDGIDLAGRRGLAFGPTGGWETADFGVTWVPVAVPWAMEIEATGRARVACSTEGCLVDADAARWGWDL